MDVAVFRNENSRCCIRIDEDHDRVRMVSVESADNEVTVDVRTMPAREFHHSYKELADYPVRRAVDHYLNPVSNGIRVTERANKLLTKILHDKVTAMNDDRKMTLAERNIHQTFVASIPKTGSVPPPVAPLIKDTTNGSKPKKETKGTWDKKESAHESNQDATLRALRNHNAAKTKAAKKAARKEKKRMNDVVATESTTTATENTVNNATATTATTSNNDKANGATKPTATKTAAKTNGDKAPAKKAASKTAAKATDKKAAASKAPAKKAPATKAPAAKKAPASKAPAKKAPASKAPAKKASKAPAKSASKPAAKKLAKGTGKPAAKQASKTAAKSKQNDGARRGRKGAFSENQKIKILVKDNPKRPGTAAYDRFELLKKSKSVGNFFAAGGASHNLHWNIERGYIAVE